MVSDLADTAFSLSSSHSKIPKKKLSRLNFDDVSSPSSPSSKTPSSNSSRSVSRSAQSRSRSIGVVEQRSLDVLKLENDLLTLLKSAKSKVPENQLSALETVLKNYFEFFKTPVEDRKAALIDLDDRDLFGKIQEVVFALSGVIKEVIESDKKLVKKPFIKKEIAGSLLNENLDKLSPLNQTYHRKYSNNSYGSQSPVSPSPVRSRIYSAKNLPKITSTPTKFVNKTKKYQDTFSSDDENQSEFSDDEYDPNRSRRGSDHQFKFHNKRSSYHQTSPNYSIIHEPQLSNNFEQFSQNGRFESPHFSQRDSSFKNNESFNSHKHNNNSILSVSNSFNHNNNSFMNNNSSLNYYNNNNNSFNHNDVSFNNSYINDSNSSHNNSYNYERPNNVSRNSSFLQYTKSSLHQSPSKSHLEHHRSLRSHTPMLSSQKRLSYSNKEITYLEGFDQAEPPEDNMFIDMSQNFDPYGKKIEALEKLKQRAVSRTNTMSNQSVRFNNISPVSNTHHSRFGNSFDDWDASFTPSSPAPNTPQLRNSSRPRPQSMIGSGYRRN